MRAGLAKQVVDTTHGVRFRLTSLADVTVEDEAHLVELDTFLHCCEISVGQNVYMTIPKEHAERVGLPKITFAGKLDDDADA